MPPLTLHPDSPCAAVTAIEATATRAGSGVLMLRYVLTGDIGGVRLPPRDTPARADGLWRHSCFEAFVGVDAGYREFNFAPSTQWAAYRFDGYREGMRTAQVTPPRIETRQTDDGFELFALLDLRDQLDLRDATWCAGLSAVIEDTTGALSWWALAHPPGKPDFHHADCFALELPETARP